MRVEVRLFGNVTHLPLEGDEILADIAAVEQDLAFGGFDQPSEDFYGGAFARAVRSEISEDFPGTDDKADLVDGRNAIVPFDQVTHFKHFRFDAAHGGEVPHYVAAGHARPRWLPDANLSVRRNIPTRDRVQTGVALWNWMFR